MQGGFETPDSLAATK